MSNDYAANTNVDPVFLEEQQHLSETYAKLVTIERDTREKLDSLRNEATKDMGDMRDELALDFTSDDMAMETLAEYQSMNSIIESYNRAMAVTVERYQKVRQLLPRPYFAKIQLQFKPGTPPRDIYLGTAGITDDARRHFIIDWRSPVAETYYNQEMGHTSYRVDDRTIEVDLKLRRQFDVDRNKLNAYFDTTVAIEDPLLLAQLAKDHSEKLSAITATIQREQNKVIRYDDVKVLLVNGIAGSGKTSVLLQRIAYLFYRYRETLDPAQVHLFTPNPMFGSYIDNVLPDMGERNPRITTWNKFIDGLGLTGRGMGTAVSEQQLHNLEAATRDVQLSVDDLNPIEYNGRVLIKASQVKNIVEKFARVPMGPRFAALVNEELYERFAARLKQLAQSDEVYSLLEAMSTTEQIDIFDQQISLDTEEDAKKWAKRYVNIQYAEGVHEIDRFAWLNVGRIGARLTGNPNMSSLEWLYLKLLITGEGDRDARFVMIDEVQDYTAAQLMVLARYFNNAHFLLLGDQHQAIKEHTATFPEIRNLFSAIHGSLDDCRLLTSYRSTPEITQLFCGLLDESERVLTSSVRREGHRPEIIACDNEQSWFETLRTQAKKAAGERGLCALIAPDRGVAKSLAKKLGESVTLLSHDAKLPASGVVVLDLPLAKGLEFDHVIITDASERVFGNDDLSRRKLYTAASRATQRLTILSLGALTPLLS